MLSEEKPQTGWFEHSEGEKRRGCVLFLEDELSHRTQWNVFFTEAGWDVYSFATVEDAIEVLDNGDHWGKIDVAVLDYSLKGSAINGLEFARTVQERSDSRIQAMVLTGEAQAISHRDTLHQTREGRIAEFLTKDCPKEELLDALDRLQRTADMRRRYLD